MDRFPLYNELLTKKKKKIDSKEAKRIADTFTLLKDNNYDDYITLQKIIYGLICHHDYITNGKTKKYRGIPFDGKPISNKNSKGIFYEDFLKLDYELKLVISNLIDLIE